jgi:hypothetical protein
MQCGEMRGEIVCVLCSTVVIKCTSGLSWLTVQIGREFYGRVVLAVRAKEYKNLMCELCS